MSAVLRLAMWSGPRNISTAMMRSWGNRPDTVVCDEPFYAHYIRERRPDHPGIDEVLRHHEADWRKVVATLLAPLPPGKTVFYQKHMAHHLLPDMDRSFLTGLTHAFLVRDPAAMLVSLARKMPDPALADTGLPQQVEVFEWVRERTGLVPPVVDASDVLRAPEAALRALSAAVGVEFTSAMLSWPPGRRDTDGVWAKHWYQEVEASTGFRPFEERTVEVPGGLEDTHRRCRELYLHLHRHRLATG